MYTVKTIETHTKMDSNVIEINVINIFEEVSDIEAERVMMEYDSKDVIKRIQIGNSVVYKLETAEGNELQQYIHRPDEPDEPENQK